jgi:hypothetical protein
MRRLAVLVVLCALASGCAQSGVSTKGTAGTAVKPLAASALPPTMLGLTVKREDVQEALAASHSTYVTALSLFSLRKGKLLEATLQVSKVDEKTVKTVPNFQAAVAQSIGGTLPRVARIGPRRVYLTRGTRQRLAVWFRGAYMFVLSTRDDYTQPRTLLRTALAIDPAVLG